MRISIKKIIICFALSIIEKEALSFDGTPPRPLPSRNNMENIELISKIKNKYNREVLFQPYSDNIAVFSGVDNLEIFNWKSKKSIVKLNLPDGSDSTFQNQKIAFSKDGKFLALCHSRTKDHKSIRIWNSEDWRVIKDIEDKYKGRGCVGIEFSMDSSLLFIISNRDISEKSPTLQFFDTKKWVEVSDISTSTFQPSLVKLTPDGRNLIMIGSVRKPLIKISNLPYPTFGIPPFPDIGALVVVNINDRKIDKAIQLSELTNSHISAAYKPNTNIVSIAYGTGLESINILTGEKNIIKQPQYIDVQTVFDYSKHGDYLIHAVDDNGFIVASGDHRSNIYKRDKSISCGIFSQSEDYLAVCDDDYVEIFKIN